MKRIRDWIDKFIIALASNQIQRAVVAERVRIWNKLFEYASIQPWHEGNKVSHIFSMGVPKMEEIILPQLPLSFRDIPQEPQISFSNDKRQVWLE